MSPNLRNLLSQAFTAGTQAGLAYRPADKARIIGDLVRKGEGLPISWQPEFDAMAPKQEQLAVEFSNGIAAGRRPDPVAVLELAERLYQAEREYALSLITEKDPS